MTMGPPLIFSIRHCGRKRRSSSATASLQHLASKKRALTCYKLNFSCALSMQYILTLTSVLIFVKEDEEVSNKGIYSFLPALPFRSFNL